MRNLKVMIAYRGTKYHGFQRQSNALAVQEAVEKRLSKVLNEPVTLIGCSRTDTGVHANNYCFNVHTSSSINCRGFVRGMNGELPDDISVLSCEDVPEGFHARFDCVGKEYVYKIHASESKNPFASDLMFHYRRPLDLERIKQAAVHFVGEHDFSSFCSECSELSTHIRKIYSLRIENCGNSVYILVKGNGFLYNMIRIMVGTLLDVNEGVFSPDDIPRILAAKDRLRAGRTAMAHGLYLNRVFYSMDELLAEE